MQGHMLLLNQSQSWLADESLEYINSKLNQYSKTRKGNSGLGCKVKTNSGEKKTLRFVINVKHETFNCTSVINDSQSK